ncbi:MAG: hypothetical protein LH481_03285, partial [Burkholderiales bacterium]|nr:hypothetical protein [Burkholderiales bacterium]
FHGVFATNAEVAATGGSERMLQMKFLTPDSVVQARNYMKRQIEADISTYWRFRPYLQSAFLMSGSPGERDANKKSIVKYAEANPLPQVRPENVDNGYTANLKNAVAFYSTIPQNKQ